MAVCSLKLGSGCHDELICVDIEGRGSSTIIIDWDDEDDMVATVTEFVVNRRRFQ